MLEQRRSSLEQANDARIRRTVLQIILFVAGAAIIVWSLYMLRIVLLLLAFAVIFCYLIAPLVDFIEKPIRFGRKTWRIPRALAIIIVYVLLAVGIVFLLERLAPPLSEQFSGLFKNLPAYSTELNAKAKWLASLPQRYRLPGSLRQSFDNGINGLLTSIFEWLQLIAAWVARMVFYLPWLVLIPVIGFFLLKDARAISARLIAPFPEGDMRYRVTMFLKDVSETLAAYIRAQLIACCLVGLIEGVGLWLLGIPYPLIFAVAAGLFEFIPLIGPLTLGLIATLVASFNGWHSALLIAGFLGIYRIIHDYVIYPRLLSQGMEIHPLAVILAVLCGAELGGVTGVFLSVPVVALLIVFWRHWRELRLDRTANSENPEEKARIESAVSSAIPEEPVRVESVVSQE